MTQHHDVPLYFSISQLNKFDQQQEISINQKQQQKLWTL